MGRLFRPMSGRLHRHLPKSFSILIMDQLEHGQSKEPFGRQGDPREDHLALEFLKTSDKDHAELAMITDLMRNDLGQFSIPGSVNVTELSKVVPFPYVYHLVSTIIATLPKNSSAFDVLKKMAPGGSITGCPNDQHVSTLIL